MKSVAAFAAIAVLAACGARDGDGALAGVIIDTLANGAVHVRNPAQGVWDARPEQRWRLVTATRIGSVDGTGPDVFGMIGSATEDALGRIWIADSQANEIRVFAGDGRHVRTIGGRGGGPGEFNRLGSIMTGPDGRIWVDAGSRRWEVFDTAGVRVAGYPGISNVGGGVRRWWRDGRLLEVNAIVVPGGDVMDSRSVYAVRRLDASGNLVPEDSVSVPPLPERQSVNFVSANGRSRRRLAVPLTHLPWVVIGRDGDFWLTDGGGPYVIRRQSATGDTLLIIERAYQPVPASADALADAREQLALPEGMSSDDNDPGRIPSVYPPFASYYVATDGRLWVLRDIGDGARALDVFSPDGIYLGALESDVDLAGLSIGLITAERVYAVERDELDVQYVRILRIERAEFEEAGYRAGG